MTHAEPHSIWLPEFCAGRLSHYFEVAKNPWTLTREGRAFTVATTGLVIVELPLNYSYPPLPDKYLAALEAFLTPTPASAIPFSFVDLRSFVTRAMYGVLKKCGTCASTGDDPVQRDNDGDPAPCRLCGGAVKAPKMVYVGGVLFNARLFELPLLKLPDTGTARWYSYHPEKPALIDGGTWRLVVMPMRDKPDGLSVTMPRFEIKPKEEKAA